MELVEVAAKPVTRTPALTLFSVLWALATLFHVWVNRQAAGALDDPSGVAVVQAATAVLAIAVLARPRSQPLLVMLAAAGAALAWFEAPFLGNHWLLAAFINLGIVLAAAAGRLGEAALPIARWSLLGFYCFAAFSKLNWSFLDPEVSCGTYFLDELAGSFGVGTPLTVTDAGWARIVPIGIAATELSIPVLLMFRRTRYIGVVVGLVFHGAIAFDSTHPFQDFSAVLVPLFLLFLPDGFAGWVRDRLSRSLRDALQAAAIVGSAAITAVVIADPGGALERFVLLDGRALAWAALFVASLVATVAFLRAEQPEPMPLLPEMRIAPAWLAIVPVLVIANGLTPYVEIKTAYGWNMYANLVTADGDANHMLVPRTLPLTDYQSDLVRVLGSNDPGLQIYVDSGWLVPYIQLRTYLSKHPNVSVRYERAGAVHDLARAADDAALVEPVPGGQQRLFNFRAVADDEPAPCQPVWFPAR